MKTQVLPKFCLSTFEQLLSLNSSVRKKNTPPNKKPHHATTYLHLIIHFPLILQLTLRKSRYSLNKIHANLKSWQSETLMPINVTFCHTYLHDINTFHKIQQKHALLYTSFSQNFKSTWDTRTCDSTETEKTKEEKELLPLSIFFIRSD